MTLGPENLLQEGLIRVRPLIPYLQALAPRTLDN